MLRYETLVLAIPEATDDECSALESQFNKIVEQNKGKLTSFDRWGKYRLAYAVNRQRYGIYFLARFDAPEAGKHNMLDEINKFLTIKLENLVMRSLTSVLDPKTPVDYRRPAPLDERPRNVDEFLKENKMDGLLKEERHEARASTSSLAAEEAPELDIDLDADLE
jgi:small subunit ribosomal protein S6